jgi:hypothetical protein
MKLNLHLFSLHYLDYSGRPQAIGDGNKRRTQANPVGRRTAMNQDDINNAISKIDFFTNLGQTIQQSQPYLNDARERLVWISDIKNSSIPDSSGIVQPADSFVQYVNSFSTENFTFQDATSAAGIGATGSMAISGKLPEYFNNGSPDVENNARNLYNRIYTSTEANQRDQMTRDELNDLNISLASDFDTAKEAFEQFRTGFKSASDVCKDIRPS